MELSIFFISSATLTVTLFFLIIILFIHRKEGIHYTWILFNVSLLIWAIGATISSISSMPSISLLFYKIGGVGVAFSAPAALHFIYFVSYRKVNKILVILAYFSAVIAASMILSSELILQNSINSFYSFYIPNAGKLFFLWFILWSLIIIYGQIILLICFIKKEYKNKLHFTYLSVTLLFAYILGSFNFLHPLDKNIFQVGNFGIALYCIAISYAIYRHRIFGIELILKKGMLYSILITVLTAIYLILIVFTESFFRGILGYRSLIVSLGCALVIAVLFTPLKNKIQAFIDKIFLGNTLYEIATENDFLRQELEHSERLKAASTLALGLTHEIKNPISTIKTFAEYLPEKLEDKEFLIKFSKLIPAETERINNIIHQLLKFSKPAPLKFQQIRIHQTIQEVLALLNNEFLRRKIKLSEIYENREVEINADPEQIKQVLLNVIFNSMEAMPQGGTITIGTKTSGNLLEISIKDEGCGISKEDLKHIFDPFYSKKESGTGLGLAITHQIIKNHRGKIEVESEINKGSSFKIKLPLCQ